MILSGKFLNSKAPLSLTNNMEVFQDDKVENCIHCHKAYTKKRGIELGNIFQLGTKYTQSMNMQYMDQQGSLQYPFMGCYGIGVGRLRLP